MKLKKKTRKKLERLARSAGALGAAFVTELLAGVSASFAATRRQDEHHERGAERHAERRTGRGDRRRSNGTAEHERAPLPRTADSH